MNLPPDMYRRIKTGLSSTWGGSDAGMVAEHMECISSEKGQLPLTLRDD
jgi:hypothetical protein